MASIRAGVITDVQVNSPMPSSTPTNYADTDAPSFWACVFFIGAVIMLFFIL